MKTVFVVGVLALLVSCTSCSFELGPKKKESVSTNLAMVQEEVRPFDSTLYLTQEQDRVEPYNTNVDTTTFIYDRGTHYVIAVGADIKRVITEDGLNYIKVVCFWVGNTPNNLTYNFRYNNGGWMDALVIEQRSTSEVPFSLMTGCYGWGYDGVTFHKEF